MTFLDSCPRRCHTCRFGPDPRVNIISHNYFGATIFYVNPIFHACTKHTKVDYHFSRERISLKLQYLYINFQPTGDHVAPPSDTCRQKGGRPVRQPRISGRTLRQCNIAVISLHNQAQRATNGLHGHQGVTYYHGPGWHGTELTGSGRQGCGNDLVRLHSTGIWLGY